ncbi:MarR family winged helix-turn-helix transcriptional regulator [Saccharopolyspora sp. CA-218241]|uniref:MarR family winged helix-turn-helix transcriptional regulator n=1 Tax=Saccharopolyspora sp. CA-218241 TaxID=3240027 RepID=UPI003D96A3B5
MDDAVGRIQDQWRRQRPDLDVSSVGVVGRVLRLTALLKQVNETALAEDGVTGAEFEVLSALRRAGGGLRPSELTRETLSSGAATTKRLTRLESLGLISRATSARDRREVDVRLTEEGYELIDRLFPEQVVRERGVLDALTEDEMARLGTLLAKALAGVERTLG